MASDPSSGPSSELASGPGRALVATYAIFTLAAGARSAVQIATKFGDAPVAYLLSGLAAVIYLLATVALWTSRRRLALAAIGVEFVGVVAVGLFSVLDSGEFPDATVWSDFGSGYGYIPLLLPVLGLLWLRRNRVAPPASGA
jgi:cytochrome bd-type quinol oxidase subunit 2